MWYRRYDISVGEKVHDRIKGEGKLVAFSDQTLQVCFCSDDACTHPDTWDYSEAGARDYLIEYQA